MVEKIHANKLLARTKSSSRSRAWTPERRARQAAMMRERKPWLRSTGPRSAEGKAIVAENARRHGFRSQDWAYICAVLRAQRAFVRQCLEDSRQNAGPA